VSDYEKINFGLYPNPSNNKVIINLGEDIIEKEDVNIRISNVLGEIVYVQNDVNESKLILEVQNWSTGMYLVEVLGGDFRGVKKLIVE
jgi:hypothetical protein